LHFKKPNGEIVTCEANEGDDIVDVSWEYDLDIEGTSQLPLEEKSLAKSSKLIPSFCFFSGMREVCSLLYMSCNLGGGCVR